MRSDLSCSLSLPLLSPTSSLTVFTALAAMPWNVVPFVFGMFILVEALSGEHVFYDLAFMLWLFVALFTPRSFRKTVRLCAPCPYLFLFSSLHWSVSTRVTLKLNQHSVLADHRSHDHDTSNY